MIRNSHFLFDEFYDSMFNTFVSIVPLVTYSVLEEDIDIDFIKNSKKEKIDFSRKKKSPKKIF